MDHHCPCFIRRFGQTMEDAYTTEGKITAATNFSTMEANSSKLAILNITGRIGKLGQHLYIIKTGYTRSDTTTEEKTFLQYHVTFRQMHQEKPLTLLRGCSQLAHQDSHNQRCKRYQDKSQPAHQNTNPPTGNIGTHHLDIECHQICHASQQTTHQHSDTSSSEY